MPLGHKRHHAVLLLRQYFRKSFEQGGIVGGGGGVHHLQGQLQLAGAGFFVKTFHRNGHLVAHIQQAFVEIVVYCRAQHRIAERAVPQRFGLGEIARTQGFVAFIGHQKLIFKAGKGAVAHAVGACQHALEQLARAQRFHAPHHFTRHQNGVVFQRQLAPVLRQQADFGIGIAGNPAGKLDVVE